MAYLYAAGYPLADIASALKLVMQATAEDASSSLLRAHRDSELAIRSAVATAYFGGTTLTRLTALLAGRQVSSDGQAIALLAATEGVTTSDLVLVLKEIYGLSAEETLQRLTGATKYVFGSDRLVSASSLWSPPAPERCWTRC